MQNEAITESKLEPEVQTQPIQISEEELSKVKEDSNEENNYDINDQ